MAVSIKVYKEKNGGGLCSARHSLKSKPHLFRVLNSFMFTNIHNYKVVAYLGYTVPGYYEIVGAPEAAQVFKGAGHHYRHKPSRKCVNQHVVNEAQPLPVADVDDLLAS